MNTQLAKHIEVEEGKTRIESVVAYTQALENSRYLLTPFFKMLNERKKALSEVREDDFAVANHYGKIMFHKGKEAELDFLLSLMPKSIGN